MNIMTYKFKIVKRGNTYTPMVKKCSIFSSWSTMADKQFPKSFESYILAQERINTYKQKLLNINGREEVVFETEITI